MSAFCYDVECLANFFSAVFIHAKTRESVSFVIHEDIDEAEEMCEFVSSASWLIGYNNTHYDNVMLNYIIHRVSLGERVTTRELHKLSQAIFADDAKHKNKIRQLRYAKNFKSIDLMRILFPDKLKRGLKSVAVNIKAENIMDTPIGFDQLIYGLSEREQILSYNRNDVMLTLSLYEHLKEKIKLRHQITQSERVNVMSESDTGIAKKLITKEYVARSGIDREKLISMRTPRGSYTVGDCVLYDIRFENPELNKWLDTVKRKEISKFNETVTIGGVRLQLGNGGIHSIDAPYYKQSGKVRILDADVDSLYPSLIINLNIAPAHLDRDIFVGFIREKRDLRLVAKKNGDKLTDATYKLVINSLYGLFGSNFFWLFDPMCVSKTTINGQFALCVWIEMLSMVPGVKVISANTDGVLCEVSDEAYDDYIACCEAFQKRFNLSVSYDEFSVYARRDINNYVAYSSKKREIKLKGIFETTPPLNKGYSKPVIAKALVEYFINNVPVEETIGNESDIHAFMRSVKTKEGYDSDLYRVVDGELVVTKQQKNNRWYVAKRGGYFVKVDKSSGKRIVFEKKKYVEVLNKIEDTELHLANVDRLHYVSQAYKIINLIKPQQLSLF